MLQECDDGDGRSRKMKGTRSRAPQRVRFQWATVSHGWPNITSGSLLDHLIMFIYSDKAILY